jgi:hypothetical protein
MNQQVGAMPNSWVMEIKKKTASPFTAKARIWTTNPSIVFFLVAIYWAVMYRVTWSHDWMFLAICAMSVAGVLSVTGFIVHIMNSRFKSNSFLDIEAVLMFTYTIFTAMLYVRY